MKFIYITQSNQLSKVANSIQSVQMEKGFRESFDNVHSIFKGLRFKKLKDKVIIEEKNKGFIGHFLYSLKVILYCLKSKELRNRNNYIFTRSTIIAFFFRALKFKNIMLELHDINVFSLSGIFLKLVRESNVYFFPITSSLKKDLINLNFDKSKIFVLQDAHGFNIHDQKAALQKYYKLNTKKNKKLKIGYFGKLNKAKGIDLIRKIINKYSYKYDFHIYTPDFEKLRGLKCKSEYITHDMVYTKMMEVDILLYIYDINSVNLARYTSPLKIYEYLSTLKPILYISVGDLTTELYNTLSLSFDDLNNFDSRLEKVIKLDNPDKLINNSFKLANERTYLKRAKKVFETISS